MDDKPNLQLVPPANLPRTMMPDTSWYPSVETMKLQLADVDRELVTMLRSLDTDPTLTDDDKALYAERYAALKAARDWLPAAITRAEKRKPSKSGFRSTRVTRDAFL